MFNKEVIWLFNIIINLFSRWLVDTIQYMLSYGEQFLVNINIEFYVIF